MGAGAAGLYTAIQASREGVPVTLVSATALAESSTYWAQGGLAAALAAGDTPERHVEDTITAGRGTVRRAAAEVLCQEAPAAVEDLLALGMSFDTEPDGQLALGLEGGHRSRRIVHAGGAATGQRLIKHLRTVAAADSGIEVLEGRRVISLLVAGDHCAGVQLQGGTAVRASATVLATGGASALWARTTNPPGAVGGGLLLAVSAGAELADLEMVQFHPTVVAAPNGGDGYLVTEAIRGEGARLLDESGERFVDELAPRDEVARAIQRQMVLTGRASVSLDMREVDPELFPNVVAALRQAGIDPVQQLVPVSPAAHYMMGGIATDLDARSTLAGPVRRRRVLVHRSAWSQPPGLQLAHRMLRVRGSGRPVGRPDRDRLRGRGAGASGWRGPDHAAERREPPGPVAGRRHRARRRWPAPAERR